MSNLDVISEVFSTLRISGGLYFQAELRGDFAVELAAERRRIRFHLVRQGQCWLTAREPQAVRLEEGDLVIVPNGVAQVLSSAPEMPPIPLSDLIGGGALNGGILTHGTGDRHTRLLCGFCHFDENVDHPLLASLPDLIVLQPRQLGGEPWVTTVLRLLSMEADLNGQGMNGILRRLLEVIFIQAVRRMTADLDPATTGYIAALSDVRLSKALLAIHKEPQVAWTVTELAKQSGMSRARFAERFVAMVGTPPIDYLTSWRLMKARAMLQDTDLSTEDIAKRCGYASVPSFTRRFKRAFGLGPGSHRRSSRSV